MPTSPAGAQRLSASKIGSLQWWHCPCFCTVVLNACRHQRSVHLTTEERIACILECSTPVGIKDRFTHGHALRRHQYAVLNACRHQRSVHRRPNGGTQPLWSAQRLSASKIGSPNSRSNLLISAWSAQRLSASKIGSRPTRSSPALRPGVLNACRHQRSVHDTTIALPNAAGFKCSTPVGIKDRFTRNHRHQPGRRRSAQRLSASKIGSPLRLRRTRDGPVSAQRLSASKIGSQGADRQGGIPERVLNACRHQRSVHLSIGAATAHSYMCSTPVGIKDRFTRSHPGRSAAASCAQRLSASKIGSPTGKIDMRWPIKCSTPVGIKDRFTFCSVATAACGDRAQRLSASKIGSRRADQRRAGWCGVLNACRHQRSVHQPGD